MSVTASKPGTGWRIPDAEEEKEIAADVSEDSEQSEPADAAVNAAADGDWAKVRLLLESGACDADEADEQGETAVAWAVRWGASTSACRETVVHAAGRGGAERRTTVGWQASWSRWYGWCRWRKRTLTRAASRG